MPFQERDELVFETSLAMMLGLRSDIRDGVGLLRNPYGKGAVTFLSGEFLRVVLVHPMRRGAFDQLHRFGQWHGRRQRQ